MKLESSQLPKPGDWGFTEVRIAGSDGTRALLLDVKEAVLDEGGERFTISGTVKGFLLDTRTDSRLSNQADSITRLLSHLQHHCPKLHSLGECDYKEPEKDPS